MNNHIKIALKLQLSAIIPFSLTINLPPEYQIILLSIISILLGFFILYMMAKGFIKTIISLITLAIEPPKDRRLDFKNKMKAIFWYLLWFVVWFIIFVATMFTLISINVT